MILVKLFFYLISPLIIFLILIVSPFIKLRFFFLPSERIGELVYQTETYFLLKKQNLEKKQFDIFFTGHIISNHFYVHLLKKRLFILNGFMVFPIFKQIKYLSKKIRYFNNFLINENLNGYRNLIFNKQNLTTKISDDFLNEGQNFLKKIGINNSDKIILLYVRDSSYLKKKFPKKYFEYHNHRDCDINNFIPAAKAAIKKGYYVFRMGEVVEKKININNEKFIDYSTLYRSEFLDVYLSYRCSFIISTGAGFDALAAVTFRKPILSVNGIPIEEVVLHPCEQMIYSFKHHYDNIKKKYLSINNIIELNLHNVLGSDEFSKKNIVLEENNSDDIENIVLEFIEMQENPTKLEKMENLLQKKMNNILLNNLNLDKDFKGFKSRISKIFIEKYNYLIIE